MKFEKPSTRPATKQPSGKVVHKNSMNYAEIKRIREEFNLERHEVYTLMSEYNSMLYLQENESDDEEEQTKRNSYLEQSQNKDKPGLSLSFFFEHTTFMKGILPEVKKIIVKALGLDADSSSGSAADIHLNSQKKEKQVRESQTISWEHYVTLYCLLEKSSYKDDGVKFWCNFFDPQGFGSVPEEDYMSLLEMMVRGKSYDEENHFTHLYAEKVKLLFEEHNWLGFENELIIAKFQRAFKSGKIKEIWFSSALGNQELVLPA